MIFIYVVEKKQMSFSIFDNELYFIIYCHVLHTNGLYLTEWEMCE